MGDQESGAVLVRDEHVGRRPDDRPDGPEVALLPALRAILHQGGLTCGSRIAPWASGSCSTRVARWPGSGPSSTGSSRAR